MSRKQQSELKDVLAAHASALAKFKAAELQCARAWTQDDEEFSKPQKHTKKDAEGRLAAHHERAPAFKVLEACLGDLVGRKQAFPASDGRFSDKLNDELDIALVQIAEAKKSVEKYRKHLETRKAELPLDMSMTQAEQAAAAAADKLQHCANSLEARRRSLEEEEADFCQQLDVSEEAKEEKTFLTKLLRRSHTEHIKRLSLLVRDLRNHVICDDEKVELCDDVVTATQDYYNNAERDI